MSYPYTGSMKVWRFPRGVQTALEIAVAIGSALLVAYGIVHLPL